MKSFAFSVFLVFALCFPLCAQEKDAPKEMGFSFGYNYDSKTRMTSVNIGFQREFPGAKPITFDDTVTGKKGFIQSDIISFLDEKGAVLGTLASTFDDQNQLKNQSLTEKDGAPRALDWFKTAPTSPLFKIAGSGVEVRYTLENQRLAERFLSIKVPSGTRELRTNYDELGRRSVDTSNGTKNLSE